MNPEEPFDIEIEEEDFECCRTAKRTLNHPKFQQLLRIFNEKFQQAFTADDLINDIAARVQFEQGIEELRIRYTSLFRNRNNILMTHIGLTNALYRRDQVLKSEGREEADGILCMPYEELPDVDAEEYV